MHPSTGHVSSCYFQFGCFLSSPFAFTYNINILYNYSKSPEVESCTYQLLDFSSILKNAVFIVYDQDGPLCPIGIFNNLCLRPDK